MIHADSKTHKREYMREWRRRNPGYNKAQCRSNYRRYPGTRREWNLQRRYGITVTQYDDLSRQQGGRCAVCGRGPGSRRLNVDHDHNTGKVRGLLCHGCNRMLGNVQDKPEILHAAIAYLGRAIEVIDRVGAEVARIVDAGAG